MSPAKAVHDVLIAAVPVTNVVVRRVFPGRAPPTAPPPFIVVTGVSVEPHGGFEAIGAATLVSARVQVDCYDKQYDTAQALAEAVSDALENFAAADGLRAVKLDSRDLFEDDALLHRVSMDFSIWTGR